MCSKMITVHATVNNQTIKKLINFFYCASDRIKVALISSDMGQGSSLICFKKVLFISYHLHQYVHDSLSLFLRP